MKAISLAIMILVAQPGAQVPDIDGQFCYFGKFTQAGNRVSIEGNLWSGVGCFQEDGSLQLIWTCASNGAKAFGVYRLNGRNLVGKYGYLDAVTIRPDGSMDGPTSPETLYLHAIDRATLPWF